MLNIMLAIIILLILINGVFRSAQTDCFSWFDYSTNFGVLFASIGINILAALEA
jgi:hypothetical protein